MSFCSAHSEKLRHDNKGLLSLYYTEKTNIFNWGKTELKFRSTDFWFSVCLQSPPQLCFFLPFHLLPSKVEHQSCGFQQTWLLGMSVYPREQFQISLDGIHLCSVLLQAESSDHVAVATRIKKHWITLRVVFHEDPGNRTWCVILGSYTTMEAVRSEFEIWLFCY